jgi:LPXTG-motif cell wall-anchored protein
MTSADKTGEKNVNKPLVIILCLASIIVAAGGSFVVYRRLKNGFAKRKK